MGAFKEYMVSGEPMSEQALEELVRRCEWFTAARAVRAAQRGTEDGQLCVTASSRALGALQLKGVDGAKLTILSSEDLIDRFLKEDDLRIVAQGDDPGEDIRTEAEFGDEDDLVSEELAEIYLAQGLRSEAVAIIVN